jgi:hypothetical protein
VGTLFSDKLDWEMSKITFFEFAKVSKSTKPRGAMVFLGIANSRQWAFWDGMNDYQKKNKDYLQAQILCDSLSLWSWTVCWE